MKITKKHHKNSQLHLVPDQPRHKIEVTCPCGPKLSMQNGHILVEHRPGRGFKGSWRPVTKNLGTKLLDQKGAPL